MLVLLALVLQNSRLSNVTQAHSGSFNIAADKKVFRKHASWKVVWFTIKCCTDARSVVYLRFSSSKARTISRIRASLFSFARKKIKFIYK
jgi:hypothetical protein